MRPEPIGFRCPECGLETNNPKAQHTAHAFVSIYMHLAPKLCDQHAPMDPKGLQWIPTIGGSR